MADNAGTPCPRCGETIPAGKTVCPQCKKIIQPQGQGLITAQKPVNCPICKIPIYTAKMAGHDILHCAECDGTAYKREALMKMQALEAKKLEISDAERDHRTPPFFEKRDKPPFLICPFCGKKMAAKKLGPMQVDMCTECSALFLDGVKYKQIGEILGSYKMAIMNASRDGGRGRRG